MNERGAQKLMREGCKSGERVILIKLHEGASIYDARTEGGGGVSPKEDVVREVA